MLGIPKKCFFRSHRCPLPLNFAATRSILSRRRIFDDVAFLLIRVQFQQITSRSNYGSCTILVFQWYGCLNPLHVYTVPPEHFVDFKRWSMKFKYPNWVFGSSRMLSGATPGVSDAGDAILVFVAVCPALRVSLTSSCS